MTLRTRNGRSTGQAGFSFIEMVVVVGIMAILAVIGYPKYGRFMANAKQSEAKNNLSHIYTLEQTYMGDNTLFGQMSIVGPGGACPQATTNQIGFKLSPCTGTYSDKVRYSYVVTSSSAYATTFLASGYSGSTAATNFVSNCAYTDAWSIDENKNLGPDTTSGRNGDTTTLCY